ncbi:MAG: GH3 auxin-responsive promoter family protein [Planctomycetaceae bacterium]|nr:GH3 auxin-responsive promoter family protein [Planctomycetaceae bacterium]
MTPKQFILKPMARLAATRAWLDTRAFIKAHSNTQLAQEQLLLKLIARHAQTDFGHDHGLAGVRSYDDFVRAVPVRSYEQMRPYFDRVFHGHTTALLPADEKVLMFSMTSGTTGQPKYIPVTRPFLDNQRRGFNIMGLSALNKHKEGWLRPILQVTSPMDEQTSPTGLPCGAISGMLARTQQKIVQRMYPAPYQVASIADSVVKYYTLMRCAIARDVAIISTANPSTIIKMIEVASAHADRLIRDVADGTFMPPGQLPSEIKALLKFGPNRRAARRLQRALDADGTLLPKRFWKPAFLTHWTGGTLKLYLRRLQDLFGEVPIRDLGLLASEGRFSIPMEDNTPAGIAEIASNVLEFIPVEEYGQESPRALPAHQVQAGHEYFLVITNWAGLWRYSIDDRVRVVSHFRQSPVFEFLSRGLRTANLTGEKLTEHQVVEAMRRASASVGTDVNRFTLQPIFSDTPCYQLVIEPIDSNGVQSALPAMMDQALADLNIEYQAKRHSGRLGPIRLNVAKAGYFDQREQEEIQRRRGRSEQYKHQYLLTNVLDETA